MGKVLEMRPRLAGQDSPVSSKPLHERPASNVWQVKATTQKGLETVKELEHIMDKKGEDSKKGSI